MDNELEKRLSDLSERAYRTNRDTSTNFLDPAECAVAERFLRFSKNMQAVFLGGFEDSERKRLVFLPDYLTPDTICEDDYISAFRIQCSFGNPTHRDYLGSLMGLGIKRETLGDIIVLDGRAYLICLPSIAGYIEENFTKVARFGIKLSRCSVSEIEPPEPDFDTVTGTVASPRLDALTSLAFGISRTTSAEYIRDGKLALNHLEETSPSKEIEEGALLSLRGYGRARLSEIGGTSKKGRIFITLHVFSKK